NNPFPALIRLIDHPHPILVDNVMTIIYGYVVQHHVSTTNFAPHQQFDAFQSCGGIEKIYSYYQRETDQKTKSIALLTLGALFRARLIDNEGMREDLIQVLKKLSIEQDEYLANLSKLIIAGLAWNHINRTVIERDGFKVPDGDTNRSRSKDRGDKQQEDLGGTRGSKVAEVGIIKKRRKDLSLLQKQQLESEKFEPPSPRGGSRSKSRGRKGGERSNSQDKKGDRSNSRDRKGGGGRGRDPNSETKKSTENSEDLAKHKLVATRRKWAVDSDVRALQNILIRIR
ncbi:MAG: hypothetical protein EZS28_045689, partial [Streblomastix strix]